MVTKGRQNIKVKVEKRMHPRLDFHCDVIIRGITGTRTITDISLGGFFFELRTAKKTQNGPGGGGEYLSTHRVRSH